MVFGISCGDENIISLIGRLELAKRERGMTEKEMYDLQLSLKTPRKREELANSWGCSALEAEKFYHELKYRRKLYRSLRRLSKENKQKTSNIQSIAVEDNDGKASSNGM